ncbi:hypothetical protein [Streptomyces sp. NBC_00154]|uniref:hypothetical protein n=1 Tax=Streptomyces sp. NBC_00154 TaxID=2975670 RepID=UPI00224CC09E|nr:hypothetical protein [Streptomyces sp. NBC_00154]MCX5315899.1 hypothetical protein [Streptomyces sp. NBC_00154]
MDENEVHCPRCGSADTDVKPGDGRVEHGRCLRCEKDFHATPGPVCGSYRIDGSYGISGIRFTTLPETVTCKDCRSEIPARDPGPEGPSEP